MASDVTGECEECLRLEGQDLVIVLDETGSMTGEFTSIQANAAAIAAAVGAAAPNSRFALVTYKDGGQVPDPQIVTTGFVTGAAAIQAALNSEFALGGADLPENVWEGLEGALSSLGWSASAQNRRIVLVGDAESNDRAAFEGAVDALNTGNLATGNDVEIFTVATDAANPLLVSEFQDIADKYNGQAQVL